MRIHADFTRRVNLNTDDMPWVPSPQAGVERRMLDRMGQEKARATSLVRYAPGSVFPAHAHPGGEEVLVLSGTFEEGSLRHPAGSYLRNPPGSSHQPASEQGAVIFVKLWQMHPDERERVHVDTTDPGRWRSHGDREVCELFEGFGERVVLLRLQAGARLLDGNEGGAEALVLEGALVERGVRQGDRAGPDAMQGCMGFGVRSWLRCPVGDGLGVVAAERGALVYLKTGHLRGTMADSAQLHQGPSTTRSHP